MDSLGRLQQRIVSPVLRGRSPSPERTNPRGWGIRRARGLSSRHHGLPQSAGPPLGRGRTKTQPMATRRGQFSTSGSTAPGSSRANSPQKSFTEYLSDVIIPIPIQMPVDEFNLHKSSGAQSFCSTSRMKYVALPHVSESRATSVTTPRPGSRPVPMCSERYMVTPVTQLSVPKTLRSPRSRPKSEQQQRFEEGSKALARCRVLKRTSEILSHRMDRLYYMSGVNLGMKNRYATDEEALKRMQALAQEARQLHAKPNTPIDSRSKLDDLAADTSDESNREPQSVQKGREEDEDNCDSLDVKSDSIFITQNGVVENSVKHTENGVVESSAKEESDQIQTQNSEENAVDINGAPDGTPSIEEHQGDTPQKPTTPANVRNRRVLLFGSSDKRPRTEPVLSKEVGRRVSSMFETFRRQEDTNEEELEVLDSPEESSEEDEEDQLTEEAVAMKIKERIRRGSMKKLQYDKSVFKGVKYTSSVHKQEEKREEFRKVTKHLVVKQEGDILYVEPNMDPEQASLFSNLFNDMDSNNDGRIELEELQNKLFRYLKSVDIPKFLRVFDLNNDRSIDRREFLAVAALNDKLCKQRTTKVEGDWNIDLEKLCYYITVYKEMFNCVDMDHDGRLSLEELMIIIAAVLDEETGTDIDLMEDILQSIDRDGNGYIEFVEYLTYIPMFLQLHNYLMRKPMLVEDIERSRRIVRGALADRQDSESSEDNIWDE